LAEQKKTLSAKAVVADLHAGMPDDEIMKKYGLSAKGLESVFDKLLKANLLSRADYNHRSSSAEQPIELVGEAGEKVVLSGERSLDILRDFAERFKVSKEDLVRLKTASLKDIKEFMEKHDISLSEAKELLKSLGLSAGSLEASASRLKDGASKLMDRVAGQDTEVWGPLANPYIGYGMVAITIIMGLIWTPYVSYIGFGVWVLIDAGKRRAEKSLWWGIGTAVLGPLVLPVYLSKRSLLAGEVREGGTAWNILKNFALFWTVTMVICVVYLLIDVGGAKELDSDAAKGIAATFGLGLIGMLWFFPMITAVILGFFLKKSSIIERGPGEPNQSVENVAGQVQ
jgi:hypothetical protein